MATSHEYSGALTFVAPAGGATAGTIIYNSTTKCAIFPLTTAASGANYIGKAEGLVKGVSRITTTDWIVGMRLAHDGTAFTTVTTAAAAVVAHAANAATATTGDVILCFPDSNAPA